MGVLDIIFPKYCVNCKKFGDFLCPDCFSRLSFNTKNICLVCGLPSYDGLTHPGCRRKYAVDGSFTGIVFNSISKKLIYQFKYKPYLTGLKNFLGDLLYESLIQYEEFNKILSQVEKDTERIVFVPIPLHSKKLKKRGYNQAEILAKILAKKFDSHVSNCLIRTRETRSQVGLNKSERQENIKGAFDFKNNSADFKNTRVVLVDDVLTTGATFSDAASVLKHHGAGEVWAVAFAKED